MYLWEILSKSWGVRSRHLQNNLSHLLLRWWRWYCTKYHKKYNISHKKYFPANVSRSIFDIVRGGNLRKYGTEGRHHTRIGLALSQTKVFPITFSLSLKTHWNLSWFLCVINSLPSDGRRWIMKREALNFVKSALEPAPHNGEGKKSN